MEVENPGKWAISLLVGAALVSIGWRFSWVLVTLHVLICLLLCIVVLLQSGKAADLAGAFGGAGSQTAFGPRGAANFLSRATTWCAIMFMATSMVLVLRQSAGPGSIGSIFERLGSKPPAPAQQKPATPANPVQVPITVPAQPAPSGQPGQTPQQQPPAQSAPAQSAPAQSTPAPAKPSPGKP
jgi:preprotein translocase subunit SecG